MVDLSKITSGGKALFLAYDQGLEHGPSDFNDENVDPTNILKLGSTGKFNAVILQKGIAQNYYNPYRDQIPLILKLNGKTNLVEGDPYSPQICSVAEAVELGAFAVGYTIYIGSKFESEMFKEFAKIEEEAHFGNIPLVAWMYLRGSGTLNRDPKELAVYAARIGLELGADIIKMKYPGDKETFKKCIEAAGKTKVVVSGGEKIEESEFLELAQTVMGCGAIGMAVGRNIWQDNDPLGLTEKLKKIIFAQP
jgi:class I fructose-bisphosphate aldolase